MWLSCAFVSRILATVAAALLLSSGDDEQPATTVTASTPRARRKGAILPRIDGSDQFGPMPPAAPKRLEQGRGVREAVGLGLDLGEAGLLVCLLGIQHGEIG